MTRSDLMKALCQAYCQDHNKSKLMDTDLIVAMADEITKLIEKEYGPLSADEGKPYRN